MQLNLLYFLLYSRFITGRDFAHLQQSGALIEEEEDDKEEEAFSPPPRFCGVIALIPHEHTEVKSN